MIAHINIGSNIGDRLGFISRAVARVLSLSDIKTGRFSPPVHSQAIGFDTPNDFINIGVEISTTLSPIQLLEALQKIEKQISPDPHRDRAGNYIDRAIDIDIIYIDNLVIDTPQLKIPHPRMGAREFVLRPLCYLSPDWTHPVYNLTASQMLTQLKTIF